VLLNEPIQDASGKPAIIQPELHGHFVEHLGGVVYDGIWVGPESSIPNIGGIRKSLVESLKKINPPVVRWPGGCFADGYHWRDGIGPRESRPRRFARWNDATEPNLFGTHEFLHFCRLIGAQPYFTGNVGTGHPREFQEWIEYCNAPAGRTTLADERAANSDRDGFGVRYWAVGNENWGCGGTMRPEDYCAEYRRFATSLPIYGVPLYLIACGPSGNDLDWTRRFFKRWVDAQRAPMNGWAPHYYCGAAGTATQFSHDQWYELLDKANQMQPLIVDQWAALGEFDPQHHIRLVIDEWGCWHPRDPQVKESHTFGQISTMRDALVAALTLDTFQRHAEKVTMANVAQLVNCLQSLYMTDGDKLVETTNYHVFAMYQPHQRGTAIPLRVDAPNVRYTRDGKPAEIFRLASSASLRDKRLTLTLVHTHVSEPLEIAVKFGREGPRIKAAAMTVLVHERLNAANTFEDPRQVQPRKKEAPSVKYRSDSVVTLPPASVTQLQFEIA